MINIFNWVESLVSFFTFNVGGGGSSSPAPAGPQTSTSYSTNLPEYAQPYYTELMKQAGKAVTLQILVVMLQVLIHINNLVVLLN